VLFQDPLLAVVMVGIFLLIAYPVHECAHAAAGYWLGDATAKMMGRLTLNPVVHFDPIGGTLTAVSLLLSPILFGWAKPTPYNPANFRDRRNGEVIVAIAGPISNVLMAVLGGVLFRVIDAVPTALPVIVYQGVYYFVAFNLFLALFNLIPVPPLDGSAILFRFLSPQQAWSLRPVLAQWGFVIAIGIFFLAGRFLSSAIFGATNALVGL
jgi:Zn-dependent protease